MPNNINKKYSMLIISSEEHLKDEILALSTYFEYTPLNIAVTGTSGLKDALDNNYDILLIDAIIPELDGMTVLEQLYSKSKKIPFIFFMSFSSQEEVVKQCFRLGATYFFAKPIDTTHILNRIEMFLDPVQYNLRHKLPTENIKTNITHNIVPANNSSIRAGMLVVHYLKNLQIRPNLKGYVYLKEAILLCIEDESYMFNITKKLYPAIAVNHKTKAQRVERDIRHAIETAWNGLNQATLDNMHLSLSIENKPINSELIASIVELLKNSL